MGAEAGVSGAGLRPGESLGVAGVGGFQRLSAHTTLGGWLPGTRVRGGLAVKLFARVKGRAARVK